MRRELKESTHTLVPALIHSHFSRFIWAHKCSHCVQQASSCDIWNHLSHRVFFYLLSNLFSEQQGGEKGFLNRRSGQPRTHTHTQYENTLQPPPLQSKINNTSLKESLKAKGKGEKEGWTHTCSCKHKYTPCFQCFHVKDYRRTDRWFTSRYWASSVFQQWKTVWNS